MTFVDVLLSLVVLIPMGALGVAILWRTRLGLDPLECVAYGISAGWAGGSLIQLGLAMVFGLTPLLVIVSAAVFIAALPGIIASGAGAETIPDGSGVAGRGSAASVSASIVMGTRAGWRRPAWLRFRWADIGEWRPFSWADPTSVTRLRSFQVSWLPTVVVVLMAIPWIRFWFRAVDYGPDGLSFGHIFLFYDWPLHLGDLASILYGDNLPMENPRFEGSPYPYHYLSTFTAALIARIGVEPGYALALHSFFATFGVALAVYAFARRLLRRTASATLAMFAFFHAGNLGWLLTARRIDLSGNFWQTLIWNPWGFNEYEKPPLFTFMTMFIYPYISQRAWTSGWTLFLFILVLIYLGLTKDSRRPFVMAGLCVGLLPLSNLSSLLGLALVLPFVAVLFPIQGRRPLLVRFPFRNWVIFATLAVIVTLPQLVLQQSDGGAISSIRWDSTAFSNGSVSMIIWFWLKNLGLVFLFVAAGLMMRRSLASNARRLLLACMPIFLIANTVAFQPFAFDNTKLVTIWLLAASVAFAAGVTAIWRQSGGVAIRLILSLLVVTTLLGGVLVDVGLLTWNQQVGVASPEEIALAEQVRAGTAPDALFATSQRANAPILMLAGRSTFVGNSAQLAAHGYDLAPYQQDLRAIMALDDDMPDLIARYGIDYVVIGFAERADFDIDEAGYSARYPVAFSSERYRIFAVSPDARRRAGERRP